MEVYSDPKGLTNGLYIVGDNVRADPSPLPATLRGERLFR